MGGLFRVHVPWPVAPPGFGRSRGVALAGVRSLRCLHSRTPCPSWAAALAQPPLPMPRCRGPLPLSAATPPRAALVLAPGATPPRHSQVPQHLLDARALEHRQHPPPCAAARASQDVEAEAALQQPCPVQPRGALLSPHLRRSGRGLLALAEYDERRDAQAHPAVPPAQVYVIDLETKKTQVFPIPFTSYGLAFSRDGKYHYCVRGPRSERGDRPGCVRRVGGWNGGRWGSEAARWQLPAPWRAVR
jgi:hypothetical protein